VFAAPAAVTVQNAQVLAQARRLAAALQEALDKRAVIDRAIGILMSRNGATAEQARAQLCRRSFA
jgi:AmiR/NasT family two-component response regulator